MATLNLGRIKPVFRGAYSGSTAYVVDDIVTHGNESFICIQAHGAGTQATSVTAYWTKLAAKGTDGTDVGTTITTQGDILFRDGSGLQRLAKGTTLQTLKMNAGATAPEWATVAAASSDYVLLTSASFSNTATVVFATSLFDGATYDSFDIFLELQDHDGNQSGSGYIHFSEDDGSSYVSNNISMNGYQMNSSTTAMNGKNTDNDSRFEYQSDGQRDSIGSLVIQLTGFNRAINKTISSTYIRPNQDGVNRAIWNVHRAFIASVDAAGNALKITPAGNVTGTYKLYGRK